MAPFSLKGRGGSWSSRKPGWGFVPISHESGHAVGCLPPSPCLSDLIINCKLLGFRHRLIAQSPALSKCLSVVWLKTAVICRGLSWFLLAWAWWSWWHLVAQPLTHSLASYGRTASRSGTRGDSQGQRCDRSGGGVGRGQSRACFGPWAEGRRCPQPPRRGWQLS